MIESNKFGETDMLKLSFVLSEEEAGPFPVSTETLWCVPEEIGYRIRNTPFFKEGISFDDVVSIARVDDATWDITGVVEASANSTLWVYIKEDAGQSVIAELNEIGCGVEGGVFQGYYAVNVPESVLISDVYDLLDPAIEEGILLVDYPSIRQD